MTGLRVPPPISLFLNVKSVPLIEARVVLSVMLSLPVAMLVPAATTRPVPLWVDTLRSTFSVPGLATAEKPARVLLAVILLFTSVCELPCAMSPVTLLSIRTLVSSALAVALGLTETPCPVEPPKCRCYARWYRALAAWTRPGWA